MLPTLKAGTISEIEGLCEIKNHPKVVSVFERYNKGDIIKKTNNVNQRFAEIDVVCDSNEEMAKTVEWIYKTLKIYDENGEDMIISRYDPKIFLTR